MEAARGRRPARAVYAALGCSRRQAGLFFFVCLTLPPVPLGLSTGATPWGLWPGCSSAGVSAGWTARLGGRRVARTWAFPGGTYGDAMVFGWACAPFAWREGGGGGGARSGALVRSGAPVARRMRTGEGHEEVAPLQWCRVRTNSTGPAQAKGGGESGWGHMGASLFFHCRRSLALALGLRLERPSCPTWPCTPPANPCAQ